MGTQTLTGLAESVSVGLAVTSHSDGITATARFDNLELTPIQPSLPAGWESRDVGAVASAGEATFDGTTFTVRVPVAPLLLKKPEEYGMRTDEALPQAEGLDGVHILVVDDEADTRDLLQNALETCGAVVRTAASAEQALALLSLEIPDIVVSDIGMPLEDGYGLIRRIRALPPERGGRVPAIALTAYARAEDRTRALLAGFKAHVPKPIDLAELLAVIGAVRR